MTQTFLDSEPVLNCYAEFVKFRTNSEDFSVFHSDRTRTLKGNSADPYHLVHKLHVAISWPYSPASQSAVAVTHYIPAATHFEYPGGILSALGLEPRTPVHMTEHA